MKLLLVVLGVALVAGGGSAAVAHAQRDDDCALRGHLGDLLGYVDTDAVAALLYGSLDDPDMQNLFTFLFGPDFRALYLAVADQPEVTGFLQSLQDSCLDVHGFISRIREYLGLPAPEWRRSAHRNGVADFWNSLVAMIPWSDIKSAAEEKYANYPEFRDLIDTLRSDRTRDLFLQLQANDTFQLMVQTLASYGIDIDSLRTILGELLGWL